MLMGVSSVKSAGRWCQCAMLVGVSSVMISDYIELMQMWCDVVRHILETPVTEREFVEQLHELNHKINFVKEQSFKDARSCLDVRETLDKLKIKVTSLVIRVTYSSTWRFTNVTQLNVTCLYEIQQNIPG